MPDVRPIKESEMVARWLWDKYPTAVQWRRVRIGPVPFPELGRMYNVTLRWADAIFLWEGNVYIVEAKLRPDAGALGQLDLYAKLFRQTPEFSNYKGWPIQKVFLTRWVDVALMELCSEKGIIYAVYEEKKKG